VKGILTPNTYTYRYDGLGNRVARIENSVEKRYVSGLAETDAGGNITAYYVYGLGLISKITPSNQSYFYHFDGIWSAIGISDSSGNIVNKYAYDAFGRVLTQEEGIPNPFRYVGQFGVMDDGNGLFYMRARYYDPEVGRFISKDPIGFLGGLNMFTYVANNPVVRVDPSGLYSSVGRLTLSKAIKHWREGCGAPLFVDINTLDLSYVTKLPRSGQVNFAWKNFSSDQ
jgi:RHS repeat-associated protein